MVAERSPFGFVSTPAPEVHDFTARIPRQQFIQNKLDGIVLHSAKENWLAGNRRILETSVAIDRSLFERNEVHYKLFDLLWDKKYEDGNIPAEEKERELTISKLIRLKDNSSNWISIANKEANVQIVASTNASYVLFELIVARVDLSKPVGNQYLFDEAREYLRHVNPYSKEGMKKDLRDSYHLLNTVQEALHLTTP